MERLESPTELAANSGLEKELFMERIECVRVRAPNDVLIVFAKILLFYIIFSDFYLFLHYIGVTRKVIF